MRSLLLLLLLLNPAWGQGTTPRQVAEAFYQVGVDPPKYKGNARWEAVQPLMTPAFYELCRQGVMESGAYTLKTQGLLIFDMNMFSGAQWGFAGYRVGTPYSEGRYTVVPVRLQRPNGRGPDNEKVELLMLKVGSKYQIDDVRLFYEGKAALKSAASKAAYQRYLKKQKSS